jgi:sporulation protein YlmC with PRC-barrel domain
MRSIQVIGIVNILIGIVWFSAPVKFYSAAMKLFTPEISPPFGVGAVQTVTFLLLLPAFILILNGVALLALGIKLERVPELKAFSEAGEYIGRLKGVEIEEGEVERFEVEEQVLEKEDVVAVDDVLLIKEREEFKGPAERHEFVGKEVYTKKGEYLGKVESVTLDKEGNATEFVTVKGDKRRVLQASDVDSSNDVIII